MGDSHYKSNIVGKAGTETISNIATITGTALVGSTSLTSPAIEGTTSLTSPAVEGTTSVTSPNVIASSYLTVGTKYVFFSKSGTEASIILEATALVGASVKGSMTLGAGANWIHNTDTAAKVITLT